MGVVHFCQSCAAGESGQVAGFDLCLRQNEVLGSSIHGQKGEDEKSFSAHMEMYYMAADDKPVTMMATHLDMNLVSQYLSSHKHHVYVHCGHLFETFVCLSNDSTAFTTDKRLNINIACDDTFSEQTAREIKSSANIQCTRF